MADPRFLPRRHRRYIYLIHLFLFILSLNFGLPTRPTHCSIAFVVFLTRNSPL